MTQQNPITSTTAKPVEVPPVSNPAGQQQGLSAKASPTTPAPVWTRYIDSRLKQFCVR